MSAETKWLVGVALALAGLILQQSAGLRTDMRDINGQLELMDSRLRAVERVQAQHSVMLAQHGELLQLLVKRELGMDVDLPKPAVSEARAAETGPGDPTG